MGLWLAAWHYGLWKTIADNGTHGDAAHPARHRPLSWSLPAARGKARQPGQQAIRTLQRYGEIDGIMSAARGLNQTNTHGALLRLLPRSCFPGRCAISFTIDSFPARSSNRPSARRQGCLDAGG